MSNQNHPAFGCGLLSKQMIVLPGSRNSYSQDTNSGSFQECPSGPAGFWQLIGHLTNKCYFNTV
jgi:hypothetical protein